MDDKRNRAAYFTAPGSVEVRSDERPVPGPGQVLLRLRACGICTMEQRLYRGVLDMYPVSPGHEPAAEVIEVTEGVVSVQPGDHVIISFLQRCMQCFFCRRGETDKCTTRPASYGTRPLKFGGLSEYAVAHGYQVFKVDPDLPFDQATLGEPLACAIHSVKRADLKFGEDVLVIGGGTMGQLHVLLARLRGCRVLLSEPDRHKLEVGLEHGAAIGIDPGADDVAAIVSAATEGRGVDAMFITVGGDAGRQELRSLRKGGRAIFYSAYYPKTEWAVDPDWLHHSQVTLTGAVHQTFDDWQEAAALLSKRLIDVSHLISGHHPLEAIDRAMKEATNGDTFRVIVEMGG